MFKFTISKSFFVNFYASIHWQVCYRKVVYHYTIPYREGIHVTNIVHIHDEVGVFQLTSALKPVNVLTLRAATWVR